LTDEISKQKNATNQGWKELCAVVTKVDSNTPMLKIPTIKNRINGHEENQELFSPYIHKLIRILSSSYCRWQFKLATNRGILHTVVVQGKVHSFGLGER
jgi:hypothetical protein